MTDIFYNGKFVGETNEPKEFAEKVKDKRRQSLLPQEMSIRLVEENDMILITTETGRVIRPLIVVKNGEPMINNEHLEQIKEGRLNFSDLVKQGIIEYLDAAEEENALVALNKEDITPDHTHLEVDKIAFLGLITALVPFGNHDQSSRLNRGSKTQKQALGLYSAAFPIRLDTDVSILHYPQKPLVRSFIYDTISFYPAGQNMVVAIMPYQGYNVEDAVILNKGSVDRGLARSTYFRPYSGTELHYAGGLADEITIPSKDVGGYRTEKSYMYLEEDGIVYPEAKLRGGDIVIGRTSPPKFLSEMEEMAIAKARKENSVMIRQEEKATIDGVFITRDSEGNKVIQVRARDLRIPEFGDKFSTPHGQKGVVGLIAPEDELPFTSSGMKPDLVFNPHSIPSRMTVGYLLELLNGKIGALKGESMDGTSFQERDVADLEKQLTELGFRADGKETFYDGISGKMIDAKIYVGNMYYLKLKYMVGNKLHARGIGKVTLLTRQPVEGRSKGGALRLGEMEKDAIIGHGASLLLKERYDSDKVTIPICIKCGSLAIVDKLRKKEFCPVCNGAAIEPIEISYAFKLFMEELTAMHIFPHLELTNKYE
ncbi:DNA-directed RNA polymerase subunit B [Nanoarchaeota archaeon]